MQGATLVAVRKAEAHGGVGKELLMRSGLTVGTIYGLGVYLTLCS